MKKSFFRWVLFPILFLLLTSVSGLKIPVNHISISPPWNPDAGVVHSYTDGASVSATSNSQDASRVLDGNPETAWQSGAPLPEGYINRPDLNIFLGKAAHFGDPELDRAMDGDLSTPAFCRMGTAGGAIQINFKRNTSLFAISLKCQVHQPLSILIVTATGEKREIGVYSPDQNFSLKRFEVPGAVASSVLLSGSTRDFELFEIAGLAGLPTESVTIDLGQVQPIGTIHTRHWAGNDAVQQLKIWLSENGNDWKEVATLDPMAIHTVLTEISPEVPARFIKTEQTLLAKDWNKTYLWEVRVYNQYDVYGQKPPAQTGHTTMREMLGVNGYWSWGTDQYSDLLKPDGGPWRYYPVASHARNYHDMTWDISYPGEKIDFASMASGKGTAAKEWLNWDREYKAWNEAKLNIQASLQFFRFDPSQWKSPRKEAYNYAYAFVRHFGSRHGNGYICTIEAGNEPWSYPAPVYREILKGMAEGATAADPGMEIFPCALQAADPSAETVGIFKNYMGARITPEAAELLDGINIHAYSYITDQSGRRRAVHPEHAHSTFWEILNAIRWRNENMPGKKIYLSEWGWDSDGAVEDCTHDECVSEEAASNYAVRGALIASRLGLERATWYFYANEKKPSSLYTRSGLTGSASANFRSKKPFFALQSLVERAGGRYFHSVIREDETAWMYLLGDANGRATHLVAWLPVDGNATLRKTIRWKTAFKPLFAFLLDGTTATGRVIQVPEKRGGEITLELSAVPLLIELE
jgi:hypothetical protein